MNLHPGIDPMRFLPLCLLLLVACGEATPPAPPPPPVTVAQPEVRDVDFFAEFTGTVRASEAVDVVARVPGVLQSMRFEPSRMVAKGDVLFVIEQGPYQASLDAARAQLKSSQAELEAARSDLTRIEQAIRSNAVSQQDLDQAKARKLRAEAGVLAARAGLDRAEIDFSYTEVQAPIAGQVSRNLVDVGNLVGQGGPTTLTTVRAIQPVYAYFEAPEALVLQFLARQREKQETPEEEAPPARALIRLANENTFHHEGFVDYIDNTVDPATGTIQLRAVFANDDLVLFPGLFVRIRLIGGVDEGAVLVREAAVGTDLGGKYVYLVGEDAVVRQQYVTLGAVQEDGTVVVEEGLDGSETYIVNGILKARPGLPVTPLTEEQARALAAKQGAQGS
jgi:RND family efflux transporter MFP subunit